MEKLCTPAFNNSRDLPRKRKILFLDNGAYNIKAMYLTLQDPPKTFSSSYLPSVCAATPLFLTLPHCVGASPYAGRGLVGEVLRHLPHYHSLLLRRPCSRRGGFLLDGLLEAYVWEHILQRFSIEDERTVEVWLTVPFGVPKQVARVLLALVTDRFHFASLTVISSTLLALIASEVTDTSHQGCRKPGEVAQCSVNTLDTQSAPGCGVVVDAGFSCTTIVPYLDYLPITTSIVRLDVGGKILTNRLKEYLSFTQVNLMEEEWVVNQIKEKCCFVAENPQPLLYLYKHQTAEAFSVLKKKKMEVKTPSIFKHPFYRVKGIVRKGIKPVPLVQVYYLPSVPYLQPLGKPAQELKDATHYSFGRVLHSKEGYNLDCRNTKEGKTRDDLRRISCGNGSHLVFFPHQESSIILAQDEEKIQQNEIKQSWVTDGFYKDKDDFRFRNTPLFSGFKEELTHSAERQSSIDYDPEPNAILSRKHGRPLDNFQGEEHNVKRTKIKHDTPAASCKFILDKSKRQRIEEAEGSQECSIPFLPYVFLQQECTGIPEIIFTPGSVGIPQCGLAEALQAAIFSRGLLSSLPLLHCCQTSDASYSSRSVFTRVVIFGGTSNFPGFKERLQKDLQQLRNPSNPSSETSRHEDFEGTQDSKSCNSRRFDYCKTKIEECVTIPSPTYFSCLTNFPPTSSALQHHDIPNFLDAEDATNFRNRSSDAPKHTRFPLSAAELQPIKGAYFLLTAPGFLPQKVLIQKHATLNLFPSAPQAEPTSVPADILNEKKGIKPRTSVNLHSFHSESTSDHHGRPSIENLMQKLEQLW